MELPLGMDLLKISQQILVTYLENETTCTKLKNPFKGRKCFKILFILSTLPIYTFFSTHFVSLENLQVVHLQWKWIEATRSKVEIRTKRCRLNFVLAKKLEIHLWGSFADIGNCFLWKYLWMIFKKLKDVREDILCWFLLKLCR